MANNIIFQNFESLKICFWGMWYYLKDEILGKRTSNMSLIIKILLNKALFIY